MVPREAAPAAERIAAETEGVADARPARSADGLVEIDVQLENAPGSDAALSTIKSLRADLDRVSGEALVGGQDASDLDKRSAAADDRLLVVPLVLAVVLLILLLLLRSVVAAVLLALTNVLSWAAALGAATWAFEHIFDFPGIDLSVPLLSFLFLVALGVDYNIFLITRAREEARTKSTLTQLGIIVGFGILLDILLVRTVLVPAMVALAGDRFWWPSDPGSDRS